MLRCMLLGNRRESEMGKAIPNLIVCALLCGWGCGGAPPASETEQPVSGKADSTAAALVDFNFFVDCVPTQFGQNVYLTGNTPQLGNWDPLHAVPLQAMSDFQGDFLG